MSVSANWYQCTLLIGRHLLPIILNKPGWLRCLSGDSSNQRMRRKRDLRHQQRCVIAASWCVGADSLAACRKPPTSRSGEEEHMESWHVISCFKNLTYFFPYFSNYDYLNMRPVAQIRLGESYWTETPERNIGERCWTEAALTNHSSVQFYFSLFAGQPSKPHFN